MKVRLVKTALYAVNTSTPCYSTHSMHLEVVIAPPPPSSPPPHHHPHHHHRQNQDEDRDCQIAGRSKVSQSPHIMTSTLCCQLCLVSSSHVTPLVSRHLRGFDRFMFSSCGRYLRRKQETWLIVQLVISGESMEVNCPHLHLAGTEMVGDVSL